LVQKEESQKMRRVQLNCKTFSQPPTFFNQKRWMSSYQHIKRVTPREVVFSISKGNAIQILDVRVPEEYSKMRVSGALSFPISTLEKRAENLDKEADTYVHCDKDSHIEPEANVEPTDSLKAAQSLKNLGFKSVFVVDGTVNDLIKAGFYYYGPKEDFQPPQSLPK